MAKNEAAGSTHRNGSFRDRARESVKDDRASTVHKTQNDATKSARKILFPTEPTTIPREKIDRAIDLVISRRK
jgi:hypothetical protein